MSAVSAASLASNSVEHKAPGREQSTFESFALAGREDELELPTSVRAKREVIRASLTFSEISVIVEVCDGKGAPSPLTEISMHSLGVRTFVQRSFDMHAEIVLGDFEVVDRSMEGTDAFKIVDCGREASLSPTASAPRLPSPPLGEV